VREAGLIFLAHGGPAGGLRSRPTPRRLLHLITRVVHLTSGFAYMTHIRLFCLLTLGLFGGILFLMRIGRVLGVRRRLAHWPVPWGLAP
jgi:hypothetical protein